MSRISFARATAVALLCIAVGGAANEVDNCAIWTTEALAGTLVADASAAPVNLALVRPGQLPPPYTYLGQQLCRYRITCAGNLSVGVHFSDFSVGSGDSFSATRCDDNSLLFNVTNGETFVGSYAFQPLGAPHVPCADIQFWSDGNGIVGNVNALAVACFAWPSEANKSLVRVNCPSGQNCEIIEGMHNPSVNWELGCEGNQGIDTAVVSYYGVPEIFVPTYLSHQHLDADVLSWFGGDHMELPRAMVGVVHFNLTGIARIKFTCVKVDTQWTWHSPDEHFINPPLNLTLEGGVWRNFTVPHYPTNKHLLNRLNGSLALKAPNESYVGVLIRRPCAPEQPDKISSGWGGYWGWPGGCVFFPTCAAETDWAMRFTGGGNGTRWGFYGPAVPLYLESCSTDVVVPFDPNEGNTALFQIRTGQVPLSWIESNASLTYPPRTMGMISAMPLMSLCPENVTYYEPGGNCFVMAWGNSSTPFAPFTANIANQPWTINFTCTSDEEVMRFIQGDPNFAFTKCYNKEGQPVLLPGGSYLLVYGSLQCEIKPGWIPPTLVGARPLPIRTVQPQCIVPNPDQCLDGEPMVYQWEDHWVIGEWKEFRYSHSEDFQIASVNCNKTLMCPAGHFVHMAGGAGLGLLDYYQIWDYNGTKADLQKTQLPINADEQTCVYYDDESCPLCPNFGWVSNGTNLTVEVFTNEFVVAKAFWGFDNFTNTTEDIPSPIGRWYWTCWPDRYAHRNASEPLVHRPNDTDVETRRYKYEVTARRARYPCYRLVCPNASDTLVFLHAYAGNSPTTTPASAPGRPQRSDSNWSWPPKPASTSSSTNGTPLRRPWTSSRPSHPASARCSIASLEAPRKCRPSSGSAPS